MVDHYLFYLYFRYFYWRFEERPTNNQFELGYKLINSFVISLLDNDFENINNVGNFTNLKIFMCVFFCRPKDIKFDAFLKNA